MSALNDMNKNDDHEFSSPVVVIGIILSYLLFTYQIGPRFMKNRPAFRLKLFMSVYNILQVAICLYVTNRTWKLASWHLFNFRDCVEYLPNTPERVAFDDLTFKIFLLKIFELTDTVVFVLRKKQNQITYLHVFHHASTITIVYLVLNFYRGNATLFPIYLNSWIHVIMYSYYFFANLLSAEVMKKYIFLKKSITVMQMIQFCFVLIQAYLLWSNCNLPFLLKSYYLLVVIVIFYGFYDFYKKAYIKNNQTNKLKNKAK